MVFAHDMATIISLLALDINLEIACFTCLEILSALLTTLRSPAVNNIIHVAEYFAQGIKYKRTCLRDPAGIN